MLNIQNSNSKFINQLIIFNKLHKKTILSDGFIYNKMHFKLPFIQ